MTREEAIDELQDLRNEVYNEDSDGYIYAKAIDMAIEALSAERTGEWDNNFKCSNCGRVLKDIHVIDARNGEAFNFCPVCGAKMNMKKADGDTMMDGDAE